MAPSGPHPPGSESVPEDVKTELISSADEAARMAADAVARLWKELGEGAETATTRQSLDSVVRDAMIAMRRVVDADAVALLLADEEEHELVARAAVGLKEEISIGPGIRSGQGMAGRVMATRKPLIVGDLTKIQLASPLLRESGVLSVVAVPMLCGEKLVGVLHADSYQYDRFDEGDARVLELMADRLAGAIERVRLFEKEREARRAAEEMADRLARMQRITSRLAAISTEEEAASVLERTLRSRSPTGEIRRSRVWLLEDGHLQPVSARSGEPGTRQRSLSVRSESVLAVCAREQRSVFVSRAVDRQEGSAALDVLEPGESFAVLPIIAGGRCSGVLAVAYASAHEFGREERDFLEAVVTQTSQAFERARLYRTLTQMADMTSFFANTAKLVSEAQDFTQMANRLAELALRALGDICLIDVVSEDGRLRRMVGRHKDPSLQRLVNRLASSYSPDPGGRHPAVEVIRAGKALWSESMSDEFLRSTTRDEEHFRLTKELGFCSYIAVPLLYEEETLGSVTLVSCSRPFRPQDVSFAEHFAGQVAAVVWNAKRFDTTFKTSQILQASLLPQPVPAVDGLDVHTTYLPGSRALDIGGDFYDLVPMPSGKVGFIVGDVAGHDRAAAAMMGHLRSGARALMAQVSGPADLVRTLQASWPYLGIDRIATCLIGEIDVSSGELALASAGHYPPLLITPDGWRFLDVEPCPPLGVQLRDVDQHHARMGPGEVLLLYTDGAIDERTLGSDISMKHLAQSAADGALDATSVCNRVVERLEVDGLDDVALMAIRRLSDT